MIKQLAAEFADRVDVVSIYIVEAHAADEWVIRGDQYNNCETACIRQPRTLQERSEAAAAFARRYSFPTDSLVIDNMDNTVEKAYSANPERLFIVEEGRIAYVGGPGPFFYNVDELRARLVELVKKQ